MRNIALAAAVALAALALPAAAQPATPGKPPAVATVQPQSRADAGQPAEKATKAKSTKAKKKIARKNKGNAPAKRKPVEHTT